MRMQNGSTMPIDTDAAHADAPGDRRYPHLPAALSANAPRLDAGGRVGPVDAAHAPRYSGPSTFALLPPIHEVEHADVAVVGIAWDAGVSFRPGARFGPQAIRDASRLLRPYNPAQRHAPFASVQVVDGGDIAANPFDLDTAITTMTEAATELVAGGTAIVALGGDHTIALPMLRAVARGHGPVALVHFDAHLDTWPDPWGATYTHGTPFRHAVEEGLLDTDAICHVGTRGPIYGERDLEDDRRMGFGVVTSGDVVRHGIDHVIGLLRERIGDRPLYVSVDIDVLDPAHAPGTGTPEAGGLSSIVLLELLRGLAGLRLVGADVVEVAPAYDVGDITSVAAAHVAYDLVTLLARRISGALSGDASAASA